MKRKEELVVNIMKTKEMIKKEKKDKIRDELLVKKGKIRRKRQWNGKKN